MIQLLETWPLIGSKYKYKSREIEWGMIAYILIAASFGRRNIEIYNFMVNIRSISKRWNKWTDILEGSSTY